MDSFCLGILEWPRQVDLAQEDDTHFAYKYTILIRLHAENNWFGCWVFVLGFFFLIFENYLIQVLRGEDDIH